jgi:hypothetical protein
MSNTLEGSLLALSGSPAKVLDDVPETSAGANILIVFANGTALAADYWRLIKNDFVVSSFDHDQKYGLPEVVDAKRDLRSKLQGKILAKATIDRKSGDLYFEFAGGAILQVFAFTSYEVWELSFPNGSVEYSNFARQ